MNINLVLHTRPNSHVRDGLPFWPQPYEQVVAITTDQTAPSDDINSVHSISAPLAFGRRLLEYWETRFDNEVANGSQRSCIEFAMYMAFGEPGQDKEEGFKRFDTLFKSENTRPLNPDQPLQLGEIALSGNLVEYGDCWCGTCCIVHAAIGLGEDSPSILEVKALGGNMSLNPLADSLAYWQGLDFPWATANIALRAFMPND